MFPKWMLALGVPVVVAVALVPGRPAAAQGWYQKAVKGVSANQFDAWIGLITVLSIGLIAVATAGLWRRLPIILGAIAGYLVYLVLANGLGWGKPIDFGAPESECGEPDSVIGVTETRGRVVGHRAVEVERHTGQHIGTRAAQPSEGAVRRPQRAAPEQ